MSKPELLILYSNNETEEPLYSFQSARGHRAPLILGEHLFLRAFSKEKSGGRGDSRKICILLALSSRTWPCAQPKDQCIRRHPQGVPTLQNRGAQVSGLRACSVCSPGPSSHLVAPVPSPHPFPDLGTDKECGDDTKGKAVR